MIVKIFGIILILLGGFLAFGMIGSLLRIMSGTKTKAKIVAIEKVNNNYEKFGSSTYSNYPILQFDYKNTTIKKVDKSVGSNPEDLNTYIYIYYSEKYGISRDFSAVEVVFSIISLAFIFFGFVALFKSN
ncbi:hypothetical protein [Kaistella antarctica]|uniref:DUF3592 domain-containing protein n=1 Tax=Kaistella antarctica TaxID=266748 RepID=A0A3S4YJM8_9FLAO|nr:hypothetical protein [Kaistella antarctica]KEY18991.1 hypothetical protein HY04_11110 [Kaistella antarctica]SEW12928.1 hypothetical protein SAMN05421765_2514 [Kaistella antarctica]VEH99117.1 Uncharacterised protein [Kaistella antarctica]